MSTLQVPERFVLLDTEYTAWEGSHARKWSGPGEYRELIQVGMIRVGEGLTEVASEKIYVKPVKNPMLSEYITNLTHITQEEIDTRGVTLAECVIRIKEFMGDDASYAYGRDGQVIQENCDLLGIPCPFSAERIVDIRPLIFPELREVGIDPTGYTSGTLIGAFGTTPEREAHDAVNDMRNLLDVLRELRSRLKTRASQ